MSDTEQALIEKRKELLESTEAAAILDNPLIMTYFRDVKDQMVDAMLDPKLDIDERTEWRLKVTAQVVSQFFKYLEQKRDLRAFIEDEINVLKGVPNE